MKKPLFTASQIAASLGITPKAVRIGLRSVKPAGAVVVRGKQSDAWGILQLPQPWIARLDAAASQNGFGNGEQFLSAGLAGSKEVSGA